MVRAPRLTLTGVAKRFVAADGASAGLDPTDLCIPPGQFVAIVGASGSGKSTLLNLLGALEPPDQGQYHVDGQDLAALTATQLADERRHRFGFVFQAYHLLPSLSLLDNVALPGLYADRPLARTHTQAGALLARLGLGQRQHDRPAHLSGGQKQRVAIARALVNDAPVLLADEPTGALDTASATQVMDLLQALHAEGRTLVLVTHDPRVAARAQRVIELRDGQVISDHTRTEPALNPPAPHSPPRAMAAPPRPLSHHRQTLRMALSALRAQRQRSALTALGVAIGVASVLSMVAFASGLRDQMLSNLNALTRHHLSISANQDLTQPDWMYRKVTPQDADVVRAVPGVSAVSVNAVQGHRGVLRGRGLNTLAAQGVEASYFRIHQLGAVAGRTLQPGDDAQRATVAVVDESLARQVQRRPIDLLDTTLVVEQLPLRIVGVVAQSPNNVATVYLPYTTLVQRLQSAAVLQSIEVQIAPTADFEAVEAAVRERLGRTKRPGEIHIDNNERQRRQLQRNATLLELLIVTIAAVSLVVAGIGVMNIMLVSVAERAREIGIRMAVGARPADIASQFFTESTLLCTLGAVLGLLLSLGVQGALGRLSGAVQALLPWPHMAAALGVTLVCGMAFGVLPAVRAARLCPAHTLSQEG